MIYSMTAFANKIAQQPHGGLTWELRSVNHRYLDLSIRLPDNLHALEPLIRDKLRQRVQRGKVECTLKYQPKPSASQNKINTVQLQQLAQAEEQLRQIHPHRTPLSVMEILSWPQMLQIAEEYNETVVTDVMLIFEQALQLFLEKRQLEGQALQSYLFKRLKDFRHTFNTIKQRLPQLMNEQRQKIRQRLVELQQEIAEERFTQEVTLLLQKADVAEELSRIEIHVQEIHNTLQEGGAAGKRLDFLLQELNREANTLSAKALDAQTTLAAVELKVLIEQMREQVQNVE